MQFAAVLCLLATTAIYVRADPNPNNPGPGDVSIQGQPCPIGWDVDPTGVWKTMNIDLMTGDNFDMVFLTHVATVDGTNPSKTAYSFPCPQVTPHSPIYFYQFTSPASPNKTWTGRFTITDSPNDVVPPSESTQPDGSKIPWGTGSLVNGTSSASGSASSLPATPTSSASLTTPSSASSDSSAPSVVYVTSTASASATPSSVSSTGANGAMAAFSPSTVLFQAGLALALAVVGFAAF